MCDVSLAMRGEIELGSDRNQSWFVVCYKPTKSCNKPVLFCVSSCFALDGSNGGQRDAVIANP